MNTPNPRGARRATLAICAIALAIIVAPAAAHASPANSIQPGRTFFHNVPSGDHPNRLVTLHNGTGQPHRIATIAISGAGGYVFTTPVNTPELAAQPLPTCRVGMRLAAGGSCAIDVRVHTTRRGWWRSVLRVVYRNRWFNSGQLEVHVT